MNCLKLIFCSFIFVFGCVNSAGTLGTFEPIDFPASRGKIEEVVDSLFANYPRYSIPEKWRHLDSWEDRGYGFLRGNIFYFENGPEEMYYVTYLGNKEKQVDQKNTQIAIRAINNGGNRWLLNDDLNQRERDRVIRRFNSEIISKLELYLNVKKSEAF